MPKYAVITAKIKYKLPSESELDEHYPDDAGVVTVRDAAETDLADLRDGSISIPDVSDTIEFTGVEVVDE